MNLPRMTKISTAAAAAMLIAVGALQPALAQPGAGQGGPDQGQQKHQDEQRGNAPQGSNPQQAGERGNAQSAGHGNGSAPQSAAGGASGSRQQAAAPAQGNSAPGHRASYAVDAQNRARMQQHYQRILGNVNGSDRPHFQAGQNVPQAYRSAITPAPASLRNRIPAIPVGYEIGYYQGYTLVYDPTTFVILTVVDLLLNN